jgi:glutathione S-transferase
MAVKLYWFPISHPSQAVRAMLELKGIPYEFVGVLPGNQRIHLRAVGFRAGTVPALKLEGRRIQGSRAIARALDEAQPKPALFPDDPAARRAVEDAERWGDEVLQDVPRRILRYGLAHDNDLRRWLVAQSLPLSGVAARLTAPVARYYAWTVGANESAARREVGELPAALDRVDGMLADGTISAEHPNAASFQVLSSVRALEGFADLAALVAAHPSADAARQLFPEAFTPSPVPPFIPPDWMPASA